jgi:tripartite-type tricarboxylate transporter receptor subunit TctC
MPFAAGSSTDTVARLIAAELQVGLSQSVIVENITGAAGRIGVQAVRNATRDGNTLLFTPIAPMAVYPYVYANLGYDPARDFDPVSQVATFDFAVAVGPAAPAANLSELVDWLRPRPEQGSYGTPGAGTLPHFFAVLFGREANLDLRHVSYRGASAAMNDTVSGQLPVVFANTGELVELHRAGRLRVLATSGTARSKLLPNVPTFREQGYSITGRGWLGIFAPHGTPVVMLDKLNELIRDALAKDAIRQTILGIGFEPTGTSREQFATTLAEDQARWQPIVKAANFKLEQ